MSKKNEVTKEMVADAMQAMFQKFGFKVSSYQFIDTPDEDVWDVVFPDEVATGMAAFSIKTIQATGKVFGVKTCRLFVRYQHHTGGGNGYSQDYIIVNKSNTFSAPDIKLLDYNTYRECVDFYHVETTKEEEKS